MLVRYYLNDKLRTDTVGIHEGDFIWQAVMQEPQKIQAMLLPSHHMLQFFADIGYLQLSGQADSLDNIHLKGSWTADEASRFNASIRDITDQQKEMYARYIKADKEEQKTLLEPFMALAERRRQRITQYIHEHPQSFFSLSLVWDRMGDDYGEVYPLYMSLKESLHGTPTGHRIDALLPVIKRKALGEQVMNFSQADSAGRMVSVGDLKGKYVLIDFWASWCGPCRAENPNVLKAYQTFKDKGFTVLGVSLDDNAGKWKKAIGDDHMPWTELSDLKGWKNDVALYYGVQAIPWNILIDPQGRIVAKGLRGEELFKKLSTLL
jgi:peroxiredoxin